MADRMGMSTGEVVVKDNNLEKALKRLKRKLERAGLFKEMKRRRHYEKPSERRRRKHQEAERRRRKKIRKESEAA
jgi:small subunit ribosomal protein S21